ncbi:hypothetical protein B9G53_02480 [Pseudanabaena sp. SR411]|uniref:GUN4 domain-containing protein n=1 Tax=Pseudanabaena sp. SR411 TaxID=1980935 RepID=UPI000B99A3C5|nr:GUN4 domain-containing protein [Pseudanabaena sp. SR411]OYQ67236.1 hypothetical protein B9G53_02480 [Pseudanabaena sp. SR411]
MINRHIRQAESYIIQKLWKSALQELKSAIQIDENNSTCHALLGVVYMNQNLIGMAKMSFQQALRLNPSEPLALKYIDKVGVTRPNSASNQQTTSSSKTASNSNLSQSPVELRSAKGIDYRKLERLLKAKEFRNADELTTSIMLNISDREKEFWLDIKHIKDFPSEDLLTIDQLWVRYSDGKFGFSVQKEVWLECGGQIYEYNYEVWRKFGAKVGWYYPPHILNMFDGKWYSYIEFMNRTDNTENALKASLPRALLLCSDQGWHGWESVVRLHNNEFYRLGYLLLSRKDL